MPILTPTHGTCRPFWSNMPTKPSYLRDVRYTISFVEGVIQCIYRPPPATDPIAGTSPLLPFVGSPEHTQTHIHKYTDSHFTVTILVKKNGVPFL